ncbi:hypothetical protein BU23DRAFT_552101 [Bimuria novae-zelandiae CBS 107.79]|uniref:Uncharacterized protein n=1 Tax=Bimuria novae-zelandiae CBS 107.79 TaxID=1447943 RepID=A0A6A5VF30_9PLEO|nr:hypothetical protein BU23DRAFT_552101 [Bimuria novae-zelandiae CBS 107.79]
MADHLTRYFVGTRTYTGSGTVPLEPSLTHEPRTLSKIITLDPTRPSLAALITWHFTGLTNPIFPLRTAPRVLAVVPTFFKNYDEAKAHMNDLFGADPSTSLSMFANLEGTLEGGEGVDVMYPPLERCRKVGVLYGREDVEVKWWNVVKVDFGAKEKREKQEKQQDKEKELGEGSDEEWEEGGGLDKLAWVRRMTGNVGKKLG